MWAVLGSELLSEEKKWLYLILITYYIYGLTYNRGLEVGISKETEMSKCHFCFRVLNLIEKRRQEYK